MMIKGMITSALREVKSFVEHTLGQQLHRKQPLSLANAVSGVLASGSLIPSLAWV